jgi:hypothetical protein
VIGLAASWLRVSRLSVVGVVAVVCAWIGWSAGAGPTGLPGLRSPVPIDAIVPCLVALGSTAGLVEEWASILRYGSRPVWVPPAVRFAGTLLAATLPWLATIGAPSSQRLLPLVAIGVSLAAVAVSVVGSFGWIPLVVASYAFLLATSQQPTVLIDESGVAAALVVLAAFALYLLAAFARGYATVRGRCGA